MNISRDQFLEFVKNKKTSVDSDHKAEWYAKKFDLKEDKKILYSWNWAAFLFGSLWVFYRRMYFYGMLLVFIPVFLVLLLYQ